MTLPEIFRSGIIAVVMEDRIRVAFRDPMVVTLLDGIADEIGNAGYSLLLLTDSLERAEGGLRDAPMDAALLLGCSTDLDPAVRVLSQRQVPLIGVEAEPRQGLPMVDIDNRAGMHRLAEHLAELGHERVAVITLPMDRDHTRGPLTQVWQDSSVAYTGLERLSGVRDVFPDAPAEVAAGSLIEEGLIAARALLDAEPGLTAIVGQSDLLALGAIQAVEERGLRVPEDISGAGFDGARIDGLSRHRLTTVVQPSVEKGRAAARLALAALAGEPVENVAFTTELRIGDTTAPPRAD